MSKLPSWEQCKRNVDNGSATALETFIYENEPAGSKDEGIFRNGLAAVLETTLSSSDAQKEALEEVLSQAEESELRSMPDASGVDNLAVSLIHSICNAPRVGEVAPESPKPTAGETSVFWY